MTQPERSAYLPEPGQERLLRLILDPRVDASTLAGLLEGFDPGKVGSEAASLLPLLARRWGTALPEPLRQKGLEIHHYLAFRNQLHLARLTGVIQQLAPAGIPTMLLKGAAMIQNYYRDPGLRFMEDSDLMTPREEIPRVLELLRAAGWRWEGPRKAPASLLDARHALALFRADGAKLDLHWRVFGAVWHPGDLQSFWDQSRQVSIHGIETRSLCPEHQLLHTCAHGSVYQEDRGLRWIADAVTLLQASPEFNWSYFCDQTRAREFSLTMRVALAYLKNVCGAPVPEKVLRGFADEPVSEFEHADFEDLTTPRNTKSGWRRGRMIWRRYSQWDTRTAGWRRWPRFVVFLQHQMPQPSLARMFLQLIKGRLQ